MAKTWIVGIGSFYADDTIGLEAIEWLKKDFKQSAQDEKVAFFTSNAPHDLLALMASQKDKKISHLYIIDAIKGTGSTSEISTYSLEDLESVNRKTSGHLASLQESLQLVHLLYFPKLPISIIGIPVFTTITEQGNSRYLRKKLCNFIHDTLS